MEANGLKWRNVNLMTGILSVRQGRVLGKDKDPKTERAVRDVEITPGMRRAISDQKARSNPDNDDYMFITEQGRPLDISNFRAKIWSPALKKARLKYRYPYQARHTFATKHLSRGYDPLWMANQMGTSLEMLFKHYAVYIPNKSWATVAQTTRLSTEKRT
jgi:integrase